MASVWCLRVGIVTQEQAVIDAVIIKVRARTNNQLWQEDPSWKKETYTDINGNLVLLGEMRFLTEEDMTTALDWMKDKAATYKPLLIAPVGRALGSFVEAHTCDHKDVVDGTHDGIATCTVTYRWDK